MVASVITSTIIRTVIISDWKLLYYPSTGLIYCGSILPKYDIFLYLFAGISVVMNMIVHIIILFMFIHGLWSLNRGMIEQFMASHAVDRTPTATKQEPPKTQPVTDTSLPSKSEVSLEVVKGHRHKASQSVDDVIEEYYKSDSSSRNAEVKRIVFLHDIMKKQTILCCTAIASSFVYGIFFTIDADNGSPQFGYDICINAICVWLTLGGSEKYWKLCIRYGPCRCCYKKSDLL